MSPVCVTVESDNLAGIVDPAGPGKNRAWYVHARVDSSVENKAVDNRASILPHDLAGIVDPEGLGIEIRTYVDGRVPAAAEQEAVVVLGSTVTSIASDDRTNVIDPKGVCKVGTGYAEHGVDAILQQEASEIGTSHNLAGVVDAVQTRDFRAWHVEGRVIPLAQQKTMFLEVGIRVDPHDLAGVVDAISDGFDRRRNVNAREAVVRL